MPRIQSLSYRQVLNSHAQFTLEFVIRFTDGSSGIGASPKGETISIYEDKKIRISPESIHQTLERDGMFGRELNQGQWDEYLEQHIPVFGRNNTYSLSLAFFEACRVTRSASELLQVKPSSLSAPCLCLNILNGGWHAYTNPVLSDFPEYLLVAKTNRVGEVIERHAAIQKVVREKLLSQPKTVVSGNPVNRFATADNRECLDFLLQVRDGLGLASEFDIMIDASAGDLWQDHRYRLAITDDASYDGPAFAAYWLGLIKDYSLRFLEDPFAEQDLENWRKLVASQSHCAIIGDNFYSSDAVRIEQGARERLTHGVIIKPNQAGTVTAIRRAIKVAQDTGQIGIASHRSISTEETFLSTLTCLYGLPYIKIGPLFTDYSSVVRLNAILRLTT